MKLFGDSDSDTDHPITDLQIDEQFAKRFEHNKKREDLQRLDELKKRGLVRDSDESDSESDDDDGAVDGVVSKEEDLRIFDVLLKVKNRDPSVKDPNVKLFDEEEDSDEEEEEEGDEGRGEERKRKEKRYLKDVMAQQLIEDGPEMEEKEEEGRRNVKSYDEVQEEMRRELLEAVEKAEKEAEGDGDLFTVKRRVDEDEEMNEEDVELKKKLNDYFGNKLDENEMFLKEFLENKMWMRKEERKEYGIGDGDSVDMSEDEEELEKQEDFEREYNFRYEENADDRILGHARFVEGSVRKKENARKRQRERKEERMAQAGKEMKEEVKRLKNLKKKEITEKLNKLRQVAGISDGSSIPLTADDLEEDFDPEVYDKKMNAAFGEDYYGADDVDPEFGSDLEDDGIGLEKPDFDKEDELLGLPKDWDVCNPGEGFSSERERYLKSKAETEAANPQGGEDEEEHEEGKRKKKRKLSLEEKAAIEKDLDELYKLDYEDIIGDLKTRFRYKTVEPRRYALNPTELLAMDDKELNQYVSLKKIVPYQEREWKVPSTKRAMIKKQLREKLHVRKGKKKSKSQDNNSAAVEAEIHKGEQPNEDTSGLSRKSKRKRRQAELKLSEARKEAYGMPVVSKKKSKKRSVQS